MRRSFVRLIVRSVLICWVAGFALMVLYARSRSWTEEQARADGVLLAYQLLDGLPSARRAHRLSELQPHFYFDLALLTRAEVERKVGRRAHPGEPVSHQVGVVKQLYYVIFHDGTGALAAGPVNPAVPRNSKPVVAILAIVIVPVMSALLALRIERQVRKVERASQALADGELSARVDNPRGPSNELAASFNDMAERIQRLVRTRDELVQAVSHELGSPLSRLRFHVELLEAHTDAHGQDRIGAMTRDLDALDELVAELLNYVQSDDLALDRVAFDPHRSLADLAELAHLEAPDDRPVEVSLDAPGDIAVFADRRLFQRAVENLLRNAVQHARGQIRLELADDGEQVRVAVHDDGPGIPEDLREKVQIPFYRLQADRSRKTGGVGLGLAIVSRIMHRHGGSLVIGTSPLGGAMIATLWPRPPHH